MAFDAGIAELFDSKIDELTQYAYGFRYPDDFYIPSSEEMFKAIAHAQNVKKNILDKLKASGYNPVIK